MSSAFSSHAQPHLLPDYADFRTFSVRVCAPTEFRVRVMMERLGRTDSDTVREEIERFDAARARILLASMSRRRTHGSTTSC
jgi:predicted DNA-binding protein